MLSILWCYWTINVAFNLLATNQITLVWCEHFDSELSEYIITKTRLYSFDPLKPHFYTVKLGFTGVYIDFFISAQKH